jgi:hypothetical protein
VWTNFQRVILVNRHSVERVTLDFELTFKDEKQECRLPNVVIMEVKQPRLLRGTPIMCALRRQAIRPASVSKYCAAIGTLRPEIRLSRLRSALHKLERIEHG